MPQVFLSHSHAESALAESLRRALELRGAAAWVCRGEIAYGSSWRGEIVAAIKRSDVVVVVWSKSANQSVHVAAEIAMAQELGKTVVPIRLGCFELAGDLPYMLQRLHRLELTPTPTDTELQEVVDALLGRLDGAALRPPVLSVAPSPQSRPSTGTVDDVLHKQNPSMLGRLLKSWLYR